jgi:TetR/AcrR family transcriptional regulator, transcriptional repressor for nem operon
MRYDSEHKEKTRQLVLSKAAAAIREHGPDRIGVATLMGKAGLTHGGFYAHFKSKDDLVAQAISLMFDETRERFLAQADDADPAVALGRYIDMYVSQYHRDSPQHGCPLPALSGDLARMPVRARKRFTAGLAALTRPIAERLETLKHPAPEQTAESMIAEMVGAIALSRAVEDPVASDRILATSRRALKARIGLKE